MECTVKEKYVLDKLAVCTLIVVVISIVFVIVSALFFYSYMYNSTPPSTSESAFLFGASIFLAVLYIALMFYVIYRIFTYKIPDITSIKTSSMVTETYTIPKNSMNMVDDNTKIPKQNMVVKTYTIPKQNIMQPAYNKTYLDIKQSKDVTVPSVSSQRLLS